MIESCHKWNYDGFLVSFAWLTTKTYMHQSILLKLTTSCKQVIMVVTSCVGLLITIHYGHWESLDCYPYSYWHLHIDYK